MDGDAEKAGQDEVVEALRRSQPNEAGAHLSAGTMGVSSERVGHAGPGQQGAEGLRETSQETVDGDPAAAPPGGDEPFTEEDPEDTESDDEVDEMSKQTFPTSDPPSTWAGTDPG